MNRKKMMAMLVVSLLIFTLAACGAKKEMRTDKEKSVSEMDKKEQDMQKEAMREEQMNVFPDFEGKDLDGNMVKGKELFSGNAVTVVNFWFTTCGPCVGELSELDALNKELEQKGGMLVGINAFTLGGDETAISEAKDILKQKDASYKNIYFDSESEAGKFAAGVYAYPTTYVVDRNGKIVGEPIVGAVTGEKQMESLRNTIRETIEKDKM